MKLCAFVLLATTAVACEKPSMSTPDGMPMADVVPDARPSGYDAWAAMCAKRYGDQISERFCAGNGPPKLQSISDLEQLLDMRTANTTMSVTTLSTGVSLRLVTPLNPRVILIRETITDPRFTILSFARGEPMVELVADDPAAQTLRFFLLKFQLPCAPTCNNADLLTPTIESGWTDYELLDEDGVENSVVDCKTCHQVDGPGTRKILRMQELRNPWLHWTFSGGVSDWFHYAHDQESTYGGFPTDSIAAEDPGILESFLFRHGFGEQPNMFDSFVIGRELAENHGTSPTWEGLYNNAVIGNAIPPPTFMPSHTNPAKAVPMYDAYRAVINGSLARDELPDVRDIFSGDALASMSIRPKPGLDGRGIVIHMCSQCHNARLDQTLSRARFNAMDLDAMSRAEKDEAIVRLELPDDAPGKMPPPRFRTLSPEELALVVEELAK
jgi:hypothetical protein